MLGAGAALLTSPKLRARTWPARGYGPEAGFPSERGRRGAHPGPISAQPWPGRALGWQSRFWEIPEETSGLLSEIYPHMRPTQVLQDHLYLQKYYPETKTYQDIFRQTQCKI